MATAGDVLRVAASQIGTKEKGNNNTKYGAEYGMNHVAWCAIFMWWCFKHAGAGGLYYGGKKTAYTPTLAGFYQSRGRYVYRNKLHTNYEVGDLIFFWRNVSVVSEAGGGRVYTRTVTRIAHVGIIEKVTFTSVHTIEGNSSGRVRRRQYSRTDPKIHGVGKPLYSGYGPYTVAGGSTSSGSASAGGGSSPAAKPAKGNSTKDLVNALNKVANTNKYSEAVAANMMMSRKLGEITKPIGEFTIEDLPPVNPVASLFVARKNSKGEQVYYYLASETNSVTQSIQWNTERKGVPSKLTIDLLSSSSYNVKEGDAVGFSWGGNKTFFGFVFSIDEESEGKLKVTCYDQLRYLKSKESYSYKKKSATWVIKRIAKDFKLRVVSNLANTKYAITRIEDDQTLFDIIQTALDLTLMATGRLYVFFDNYGRLTLREVQKNKVNYLVCQDDIGKWQLKRTIDTDVYNQVKVRVKGSKRVKTKGKKTKKVATRTRVYIMKSTALQNKWGVLQLTEKMENATEKQAKRRAKDLLGAYKAPKKSLRVEDAIGDVRVRAGVLLPVAFSPSGINIKNYMVVERAAHKFENGKHTMDLDLIGAGFDVG